MDNVVILLDFADATWTLTPVMPRWVAEWELRRIGEYGMPWEGRQVIKALIIPRDDHLH